MSTVFLTGGTGFVGMDVLSRLLAETDHDVVALVRAADEAAAQKRMACVLTRLGAERHAGRVEGG